MKKAKIFILSGPGGVGKTTLVRGLFKKKEIKETCIRGVTVTTREKRANEEEGKDYFFVDKEEFLRLEKRKFFLESEEVLGNYYGTPKILYKLAKGQKKNLILCIDVKGGMHLKKHSKVGKIITIFITVPSEKDLYKRMKKRADKKASIEKRVELAKKELQFSKKYDLLVTNKNVNSTIKELKNIILEIK